MGDGLLDSRFVDLGFEPRQEHSYSESKMLCWLDVSVLNPRVRMITYTR